MHNITGLYVKDTQLNSTPTFLRYCKNLCLNRFYKRNNVINLNTLIPVSIANLHNPTLIVAPLNVKEKIILVKKSLQVLKVLTLMTIPSPEERSEYLSYTDMVTTFFI